MSEALTVYFDRTVTKEVQHVPEVRGVAEINNSAWSVNPQDIWWITSIPVDKEVSSRVKLVAEAPNQSRQHGISVTHERVTGRDENLTHARSAVTNTLPELSSEDKPVCV